MLDGRKRGTDSGRQGGELFSLLYIASPGICVFCSSRYRRSLRRIAVRRSSNFPSCTGVGFAFALTWLQTAALCIIQRGSWRLHLTGYVLTVRPQVLSQRTETRSGQLRSLTHRPLNHSASGRLLHIQPWHTSTSDQLEYALNKELIPAQSCE